MFKAILHTMLGAVIAATMGVAFASVGQVPLPGFQAVDGSWLLGLAGGVNDTYQYGITAAGTTQATAAQLPSQISLIEVDTAAASSGVALPPCYQGTRLDLYNNGANPLAVYPNANNNPITAAQDTINNTTSVSVNSHTAEILFCAKNGNWAAK